MYATCLFCRAALGANEVIEHFPVGGRLAFDTAKGRLWVVCTACGRWNLSPLEERWEAIEECERGYRGTTVRVSTGNIGLARLPDGTELVRIGAPLRPEFAAWRYGRRFFRRRRDAQLLAATGVALTAAVGVAAGPVIAPALALGAISIIVVPGITSALGVIPVVGTLAARDYLLHERVVARLVAPGHHPRVVTVRAHHLSNVRLQADVRGGLPELEVPCDEGWAYFSGGAALRTAGVLLASANRFGASGEAVRDAVARIEATGDAEHYLARAAHMGGTRARIMSLLNDYRRLGAFHLESSERLALEMVLHEEAERRALDGELAQLLDAWRDAEEIAAIADGL